MMGFVTNVLKIFGIVFLRFRPVPRVWNIWLVSVNLLCFAFIQHIEAQVVLGTTLVAVVVQAIIYGKIGFTRILGIAHLTWLPMFAWIATRFAALDDTPGLQSWLVVLAVTNAISFVIDSSDVARFMRGERQPHYRWS